MIVNDVKLACSFKKMTDMQAFIHLHIKRRVFTIRLCTSISQLSFCKRIAGGKKGHINTFCEEAFSNVRGNLLPGSILAWWCSPGNRGKDSDLHGCSIA